MTDKERIEEVRFFFKKNKTEFSEILGYTTPQSYTNYLRGANNLSMKMVKALKQHDSRISIDWILEGQGQMLLKQSNGSSNQSISNQNGIVSHVANNNNHNNNNSNNNNNTSTDKEKELEYLRNENELLKKALEDKEEIIRLLKR
jgi:hypothetical protein